MKKLLVVMSAVIFSFALNAQEGAAQSVVGEGAAEVKPLSKAWPAWFAISQWPRSADVVGLRLTIPFSTSQENVTGLDVGFWGKCLSFEGFQLNLLRNDAIDSAAGLQVGIYNSVGCGNLLGVQVGFWNEAQSFRGIQAGLVNVVGEAQGFQIGIINRAETFYGYQIGVINVIRSAEVSFFPLINVGF